MLKLGNLPKTPQGVFEFWVAENRQRMPWPDVVWEHDAWDCDHKLSTRAGVRQQTVVHFCTLASMASAMRVPFRQPFGDYAKAILVEKAIAAPTKADQYRRLAMAARYLEQTLIAATGTADPWKLRVAHFIATEQTIASSDLSSATKWGYIRALKQAAELSVTPLTTGVAEYKPAFKAPKFRRAVTREEQAADLAKMPNDEAFSALADLFVCATEGRDRIFLAVIALAAHLGFRIGEILTLPFDCMVEERGKLGLRYWPEKAGEPYIKWVPAPARQAVERALRDLREHCAKARSAALFIEANPGLLPPGLEKFSEVVDSRQLAEAFEMADMGSAIMWAKAHGVASLSPLTRTYNRSYLEDITRLRRPDLLAAFTGADLPSSVEADDLCSIWGLKPSGVRSLLYGWKAIPTTTATNIARYRIDDIRATLLRLQFQGPVVKTPSGAQSLGQSLVVVFDGQMSPGGRVNPFIPGPLPYSTVRLWLGEKGRSGSIFDRHQKTRADGTRITIRSHQFRHWINTAAKNGGLSDVELARWSGRRDLKQNQAYVHGTVPAARDAMKAAIREGKVGGPIASLYAILEPTTREEFLDAAIGAVFMMPWGACSHNFASKPCEKHMACMDNCGKLLRRKGDQGEREAIKRFITQQEDSIEKCRQEGAKEDSPWIAQLSRRIAGAQQALAVDNDNTELGGLAPVFPNGRDLFQPA